MPPYTLKQLAEAGYIMGLPTIGEVANHMESHYDAYFLIEDFAAQMADFEKLVHRHEEDSIFKYLTDEDKKRMDDELEKALEESPLPDMEEFE
jgi:DNA-directed RNA polymerase sigma subunit (sigma70/sigma32)